MGIVQDVLSIGRHGCKMICYSDPFLCPRFPLFGGWQTRYYTGYNLPSYEYLYHTGNQYLLKMRFIDHIFDDQVIERVTVKIILPEGAKYVSMFNYSFINWVVWR